MDNPVLSVTNVTPKEGEDITFTCQETTSDTGTTYEWLYKGTVVPNQVGKTYILTSPTRTNDGQYTCKVTTNNFPAKKTSNAETVKFLCKYQKCQIVNPNCILQQHSTAQPG